MSGYQLPSAAFGVLFLEDSHGEDTRIANNAYGRGNGGGWLLRWLQDEVFQVSQGLVFGECKHGFLGQKMSVYVVVAHNTHHRSTDFLCETEAAPTWHAPTGGKTVAAAARLTSLQRMTGNERAPGTIQEHFDGYRLPRVLQVLDGLIGSCESGRRQLEWWSAALSRGDLTGI